MRWNGVRFRCAAVATHQGQVTAAVRNQTLWYVCLTVSADLTKWHGLIQDTILKDDTEQCTQAGRERRVSSGSSST